MNKQYIFLDLDGTLITPNNTISTRNKEAIIEANRLGHHVYLCTGRSACSIEDELKNLPIDGIISSAGGHVEVGNTVIHESFIDPVIVDKVIQVFLDHGIEFSLESSRCSYVTPDIIRLFVVGGGNYNNSELDRLIAQANDDFQSRPFDEFKGQGVYKISFVAKNYEQLEEPKRLLGDDFHFIVHELFSKVTINGEIMIKNTTKATGIQHVLKYCQGSVEDTVGIGDSMNDYAMIEYVKHGVVTKEAPQQLKDIASMIGLGVHEDAVADAFKKLNIIE